MTPANNGYMTPANPITYQPPAPSIPIGSSMYGGTIDIPGGYMTPNVPVQAPVQAPVQTPAQNPGYPIGTNADGTTRYSKIQPPAQPPAQTTPDIWGAFDAQLNALLGNAGQPATGSGSSGGGYNTGLVSGGKDMLAQIEANKNNQISQVQADYEAALKLLADTEASTQKNYGSSKDYITNSEAANKANIAASLMRNKDQLRQGYQDATVLARQRARALGGAASSGYLDTLQGLDKTLLQQLGSQDQAAQSNITQAALQAQKAMSDLESQLQKTIDSINAQKTMSLREKDKAIAQANIDASNNALEVKKWLMGQQASASARSSSASSIAANTKAALSGIQSNYIQALVLANTLPAADRDAAIAKVNATFGQKYTSTGGSVGDLNNAYGFINPYDKYSTQKGIDSAFTPTKTGQGKDYVMNGYNPDTKTKFDPNDKTTINEYRAIYGLPPIQ